MIPNVPPEKVLELSKTIRPLVVDELGDLRYSVHTELFNTAYTWNRNFGEKVNLQEGTKVEHIRTYHSYGHPSLFKPSIAEVISCIPEHMWDKVYAFEIVDKPRDAADLNKEREALNAGFHVATTRLYLKP